MRKLFLVRFYPKKKSNKHILIIHQLAVGWKFRKWKKQNWVKNVTDDASVSLASLSVSLASLMRHRLTSAVYGQGQLVFSEILCDFRASDFRKFGIYEACVQHTKLTSPTMPSVMVHNLIREHLMAVVLYYCYYTSWVARSCPGLYDSPTHPPPSPAGAPPQF